ncbi:MAG: PAS domain-containing sensor histidine kinase, partial [Gemmobacter sp.]|nr:PAS domain-containing sensor histidine kinase [Gemmobacter sp.]
MSRRLDVLSLVPLVAIVALVGLVTALVWILGQADAERARTKLATDALWVEQTLRFQMSVNEDMLARLALDAAGGAAAADLQARARVHIAANPEMLFLRWYDAKGQLVAAVPEGAGGAAEAQLMRRLLAAPAQTARPVFGPVEAGVAPMGLRLPGAAGGVVLAGVSLPVMFDRHIPWWIAEQYGVRLLPAAGQPGAAHEGRSLSESALAARPLAERARRPAAPGAPQHAISFDPPLAGTVLQITAYDRPATFGSTAILAAILGLAAFAVLALVVLHRNALHRRRAEDRLRAEMAFRR